MNATGAASAICGAYTQEAYAGRTGVTQILRTQRGWVISSRWLSERREPHAAAGQKLRGVARSAQLSVQSGDQTDTGRRATL